MEVRYKNETIRMLDSFNNTKQFSRPRSNSRPDQEAQVRGEIGNTWDAKHLTNFLNKSNYTNQNWNQTQRNGRTQSIHRRAISTHDHFFKTTKDNKNASLIGYTKINPLVTGIRADKHRETPIKYFLEQTTVPPEAKTIFRDGNYRFRANSVKFNKTDSITLQHIEQKSPTPFGQERLKRLIQKRHPHGITGIDHPEQANPTFYSKYQNDNQKIRVEPNSGRTHVIDRDWKTKGRSPENVLQQYRGTRCKIQQLRKFSNDNVHGYNITNNREF